jgi:hypothetical protein
MVYSIPGRVKKQIIIVVAGLLILMFAFPGITQDLKKELPLSFKVVVVNQMKYDRSDEMVIVSKEAIAKQFPDFNSSAFAVFDAEKEIPSQYNQQDKENEGIVLVFDHLKAGEKRQLIVRYKKTGTLKRSYKKKTQAELSHKHGGKWEKREYIGGDFKNVSYLRVPPEHKDHSWFIRYEGPGWESDKVGYRFYLDQRNATDVFAKKTNEIVLHKVGLDGFDSYHEMQEWGMDVMKVGPSLGIGSIGARNKGKVTRVEKTDSVTCRILENGDLYSSFNTSYYGWKVGDKKYDVKSHISIHAGTRITQQSLQLSNDTDSLCTGIVKDKNAKLFSSRGGNSGFGYLATFGKQSLNSDELGLAVFFSPQNVVDFTEDSSSNIVTLKSSGKKLKYYFLATWVHEPDGIKNEENFKQYLSDVSRQLANPVSVHVER